MERGQLDRRQQDRADDALVGLLTLGLLYGLGYLFLDARAATGLMAVWGCFVAAGAWARVYRPHSVRPMLVYAAIVWFLLVATFTMGLPT